jgi:hypothetical protein
MQTLTKPTFESLSKNFHHWQKIGDLIDQCIDLALNLRQSGHPGGSRSKVPLLVASTLGAGMRWDVRHPESAFGDRFVLVAGHCNPVIYALLAVYNEALRARFELTGDASTRCTARSTTRSTGSTCSSCATTAACPATPRWKGARCSSSSTPARRGTAHRRRWARPWR